MGLIECVAIVTLNIITIIVFIKNGNLRKRSTYLFINLAVVDVLVGGVATYGLFYEVGAHCNVWECNSIEQSTGYVLDTLRRLFPVSSLANIATISVERLHATPEFVLSMFLESGSISDPIKMVLIQNRV